MNPSCSKLSLGPLHITELPITSHSSFILQSFTEDLELGRGAAGVEELRARTAKAATAAAEARLELQRRYSRLRPVLLQRTLGMECRVGDMLALAFAHGFLMTTEHVSRMAGPMGQLLLNSRAW